MVQETREFRETRDQMFKCAQLAMQLINEMDKLPVHVLGASRGCAQYVLQTMRNEPAELPTEPDTVSNETATEPTTMTEED